MDKQIVFTEPNVAQLHEVNEMRMEPDRVKVKTVFSTISNGTERANLTGDPTIGINVKDGAPAVFPRRLGYSTSGIVVETGSEVKGFEVGDRVAMCWTTHRSHNVVGTNGLVKIKSEKISFAAASVAHIAAFPLAAIRKTRLEIGESAMVMGLGPLGILAIGLLRAAGATPVIAVDPVKERREKALKFGADYAFDPYEPSFVDEIKALTGGVKVAIEVTGVGEGLNQALDCMARFGRVALLGCTRNSDFTVDYYRKVHGPGITLIGAHTMARPQNESHPGYFTTLDDMRTVLDLIALGRLDIDSLVDEVHTPDECGEVYNRLAFDKKFPQFVQFDWRML